MSGYTEIIKTLREIRDFLQCKLTPQFLNSLQGAANAIQAILGDPTLQANLKESLNQINTLLQNVNKSDLVNQLSEVGRKVRDILQAIDPQTIGDITKSLSHLLNEADKAGLIQNIMKALESVSSLRDLVEVAKDLVMPAQIAMYGVTGAYIGMVLTSAIQTYLQSKKDSQLQASIDKLIAINTQQLYVQIHQLRTNAGSYIFQNEVAEQQLPGLVLSERLIRLRDENTHIVDVLSPMDIDSLELLAKAQEFGKKMLQTLYQAELDNESMSDYLDRINNDLVDIDQLIEYVSFEPTYGDGVEKPTLPRDDLNYWQIKKLYGDKQITTIMQSLVIEFQHQGGNDLYLGLADSFDNSSRLLSESIKQIAEEKLDGVPDTPWTNTIIQLHTHYHQQANQYITMQWESTDWKHLPHGKKVLTERVRSIIRTRALIEFCHQTAPYLCLPRNVPREMYNGIKDVPVGFYRLIRHPIDSMSNIGRTLFTTDGWQGLGRGLYAHPVRIVTSQAVSFATANGVSAVAGALSHTANVKATLSLLPSSSGVSAGVSLKMNAVHYATVPQVTLPQLATGVTTSELIQAEEMDTGIDSRPAPSSKKEMVCTMEMTKPVESSAPSISQRSYSELMDRILWVKNYTELYTIISSWYEEINNSNIKKTPSSSVLENVVDAKQEVPEQTCTTQSKVRMKIASNAADSPLLEDMPWVLPSPRIAGALTLTGYDQFGLLGRATMVEGKKPPTRKFLQKGANQQTTPKFHME